MKEKTMQKELFKEFEESKKRMGKSQSMLPKNYILFNVTYEQIVFITIALIMLMVLLFSLGVEKGKHLVYREVPKEKPSLKVASVSDLKKDIEEDIKVETVEPVLEKNKIINSKLYTIQVIAYRSKRLAQEELVRLSKKGYNTFIIVGGGYYQICVGEYSDKDEAKSDLSELKKNYKDSFVRKR